MKYKKYTVQSFNYAKDRLAKKKILLKTSWQDFTGGSMVCSFKCGVCGYLWEQYFHYVLEKKYCPECRKKGRRKKTWLKYKPYLDRKGLGMLDPFDGSEEEIQVFEKRWDCVVYLFLHGSL